MSRVIKKLAEGGTSEQKKLFEWAGNKYDKDALRNTYAKKYQDEVNSGKYSKRELQLLDEGFKQVVSAIDSDDFGRDISGEWNNSAGISSTGFTDKNIFGKLKKTNNNSVSLAASILNDAFSSLTPYTEQPVETPKKEQFNLNLRDRLKSRLMPAEKDWNQNIWTDLERGQKDANGKLLTTGRQQALRDTLMSMADDLENPENKDKYQYQDFIKDPNEYAAQIRALVGNEQTKGALGDVIGDEGDLSALARLGITGFDGLLQDAEENIQQDPNVTGETPEQKQQRLRMEQINKEWDDFVNQTRQGDQSKQWGVKLSTTLDQVVPKKPAELFQASIPNVSLNSSTPEHPIPVDIKLDRELSERPLDKTGMASLREHIENYIQNDPRAQEYTEGNYTYIIPTLSRDWKYMIRYNNKTKIAQRVLVSESPKVLEYIKKGFLRSKDPNIANRTGEFKAGGVVKMQMGDVFDEMENEYKVSTPARKVNTQPNTSTNTSTNTKTHTKTPVGTGDNRKPLQEDTPLEWDDYTRLGAIGSDLVGLVAGFVPGGSAVAAGSGFLSTGANFAADMKDGFQWSDAGNAALGLGMDVLSVIPGLGQAAKGSKIAKNLIKWAPRLMTYWAAQENTGPAVASLTKLVKNGWSDLTVDDWRNISNGIHLVVSGGRGASRAIKAGKLDTQLRTGNKQLQTTAGVKSITPSQYEALKKTKGIEGANKYLKEQGIEGEVESPFRAWYNLRRQITPNPTVTPEYDFSRYTPRHETSKSKVVRDTETGELTTIYSPKKRLASASDRIVANMQTDNPLRAVQNTFSTTPGKNKVGNVESVKPSEVSKNTKKYKDIIETGRPNITLIRKKYSKYKNLGDKELLEQVKDEISPAAYNAAKRELEVTPKSKKEPTQEAKTESNTETKPSETTPVQEKADPLDIIKQRAKAKFDQKKAISDQKKLDEEWYKLERDRFLPVLVPRSGKSKMLPPKSTSNRVIYQPAETPGGAIERVKKQLTSKPINYKELIDSRYKSSTEDRLSRMAPWIYMEKKGGVLKAQKGDVMNRETVPAPNPYLLVENNVANATNPKLLNRFYNMDKALSDMNTNNWLASTSVESLNNLHQLRNGIPSGINKRGVLGFNTAFDKDLNILNTKVFGRDPNRFDYTGPTTHNRNAFLARMASTYNNPNNAINTADGRAYFNGTRWVAAPVQSRELTNPGLENSLNLNLVSKNTATPQQLSRRGGINGAKVVDRNGIQFLPEDAIAAGRMIGTVATNNYANKRLQSALRPTLIDTYENYIPQTEDYLAKTSAYNNAAELQRQAHRVASNTSDASLGAAAMLEGTRQGRQLALQGDLANSQRLYQTGEQGRAESNAAKARRVEVANKNRASMNQIDFAKAQMDAQTKVGNWMQAVQPWAAGIENRLRTNRATQRQLDLKVGELNSQEKYYTDREALINEYRSKDLSNPAVKAAFQNADMKLRNDAIRSSLNDTATTVGKGVFFNRPLIKNSLFRNQTTTFAKKGTKLSARDTALIQRAKDFNKMLREQQKNFLKELQSIRKENSQIMRQVSSFTAQLIKSGMSWK